MNKQIRLFLCYGRLASSPLANRLRVDVEKLGYEVWQDPRKIRSGLEWEEQNLDSLRSTQVVIPLQRPHAEHGGADPNNPDCVVTVCLNERTFSRFATPPTPNVPIMAITGEPPFPVFRLGYVSMTQWMQSDEKYRLGFERLVASDPDIGKSKFVAEMIHRNPENQDLAYHIFRADDPETLRPSTFLGYSTT